MAIWRNNPNANGPQSASDNGRYITFANPSDLEHGPRVFTYSGDANLGKNWTYHIVAQYNKAHNDTELGLDSANRVGTTSNLAGWSVGQNWFASNGNWIATPSNLGVRNLRFKLEGIHKNEDATGEPAVSGSVQVGQTVTADEGTLSDLNGTSGATYSYKWLRFEPDSNSNVEIEGATEATYEVQSADQGKRLGVEVSFTDDDNYQEVVESGPLTGVVVGSNFPRITVAPKKTPVEGGSGVDGEDAVFTLTRTGDMAAALTVDVSIAGDGADASELTAITEAIFAAGSATAEVSVQTNAIAIGGTDQMVTLTVQDSGDYVTGTPSLATVTVTAPQDTRATGQPVIEGTVRVDEMLTAEVGTIIDPDDQPAKTVLMCVWQRQETLDDDSSWGNIPSATSCDYTVTAADLDKRLRVMATFNDDVFSQSETLTSEATEAVRPANTPATGKPTITGTARVGATLTAAPGNIDDPDTGVPTAASGFAYKWDRMNSDGTVDTEDVGGDSSTYTLVDADLGKKIRVPLSFTDAISAQEERASDLYPSGTDTVEAAAPDPVISVVHNGNVQSGENAVFTLSRTGDTTDPLTVNISITGNGASTTPPLRETAMFEATMATVEVSVPTVIIAPGGGSKSVVLQIQLGDGYDVVGGGMLNQASLLVLAPTNTRATGKVILTGRPEVGQTLTAAPENFGDANGLTAPTTYYYQWIRNPLVSELEEDTFESWFTQTPTYTLTAADEGHWIQVQFQFQDDAGSLEIVHSNVIGPVVAAGASQTGSPATGTPRILGTPQVGRTIEVTSGDIDDDDGLPGFYTYTWMSAADSQGTDIQIMGQHFSLTATRTLLSHLEGRYLQVIVSFTDGAGNLEFRSSEWTTAVVAAEANQPTNHPAYGEPMFPSGTPQVGQALTVTTDSIKDTDGRPQAAVDYHFQWRRAYDDSGMSSGEVIPGATSATYTPIAADVGKHLRVTVLFTDGGGTVEMRSSGWSDAVAAAPVGQPPGGSSDGRPTVTGTPQVGQTLTATREGINDADGLPASPGDYSYQWSHADDNSGMNAAQISGATMATYTPVDADVGKHLQVTVSFTDDDGNLETRSSDWTVAVAAAEARLPTFSIDGPPAPASAIEPTDANAGPANTLEFTVTLSEPLNSPATVTYSLGGTATEGDDYSEHTGKTLTFAMGIAELPIRITALADIISEGSGESVIVTLVSASAGAAVGESDSATGTITEPPGQVQVSATKPTFDYSDEDEQTTVSFAIETDSTAAPAGTVEWRVVFRDSTGAMQIERKDTAEFEAGVNSVQVSATLDGNPPSDGRIEIQLQPFSERGGASVSAVAPFSQLTEDDEETETVGAVKWVVASLALASSSATSNDRAITSALTAFGRSTATGIVESIWNRAEAHRHGGISSFAKLGGRSVDTSAYASDAGALRAAQETARLFGIEVVDPAAAPSPFSSGASLAEGNFEDIRSWSGFADDSNVAERSRFALALGEKGGSAIVYWGSGSLSNFSSELDDAGDSTLKSDGSTTTISLGLDYRRSNNTLLGIAVSSSSGSAEYEFDNLSEGRGDLSSSLISFTPWFRWRSASGMEIWGAFGFGLGSADGMRDDEKVEMDLSAQIIAAGAWNQVTTYGRSNIALKADYFTATVSSDGAGEAVDGTDAGSSRIRVAAEMSSGRSPSSRSAAAYALELGARLDSGEAESGFGVDAAAEFDYGGPRSSVSVTGRGGLTLFHGQEGFSETGFGLGITYDPGADSRGVQLSLNPAWNAPRMGAADSLWNAASADSLSLSSSEGAEVDGRLGYGINTMKDNTLATLYGGVRIEEEESWLRLGSDLTGSDRQTGGLRLDLYGETGVRRAKPERLVRLEGSVNF